MGACITKIATARTKSNTSTNTISNALARAGTKARARARSRSKSNSKSNTTNTTNTSTDAYSIVNPNPINWADITYSSASPFVPAISIAKCVKVYDGDTITIVSALSADSHLYRWSVRLRNIDAPEMRTKCANEKICAKLAQEAMSKQVLNQMVTLKNVGYDKYGRVLADVFVGEVNVTDSLLAQNLAVPYDGGTKLAPPDWIEFHDIFRNRRDQKK